MGSRLMLVAATLLVGCGNAAQRELDSAQHLWSSGRPTAYETVVRRSCFCGDVDPYRVQVLGADVVSAVRLSADGVETTVAPADYRTWFTVEGLFAAVQQAIDASVDHLEARYDPQLGHPLSITIDPHANASDDETGYEAARLDPLP
jgi:hypothetical protein